MGLRENEEGFLWRRKRDIVKMKAQLVISNAFNFNAFNKRSKRLLMVHVHDGLSRRRFLYSKSLSLV